LSKGAEERNRENISEERINQEVKDISSGLSHDLRGPLQIIRNCTYLLEIDPDDKSPIADINNAVTKITDMLNSFREYYRGHEINCIPTAINPMVEYALREVEIPPNIKVQTFLDKRLGKASIDPVKLKKALIRLIQSAINSLPADGVLKIMTHKSDEHFTITVSDNGAPIPENDIPEITKPFGSKIRDNTGLGIPICNRVVRAHGGQLSFTSDSAGTTFNIIIPV
jgi:signal transduction histidine kinase